MRLYTFMDHSKCREHCPVIPNHPGAQGGRLPRSNRMKPLRASEPSTGIVKQKGQVMSENPKEFGNFRTPGQPPSCVCCWKLTRRSVQYIHIYIDIYYCYYLLLYNIYIYIYNPQNPIAIFWAPQCGKPVPSLRLPPTNNDPAKMDGHNHIINQLYMKYCLFYWMYRYKSYIHIEETDR